MPKSERVSKDLRALENAMASVKSGESQMVIVIEVRNDMTNLRITEPFSEVEALGHLELAKHLLISTRLGTPTAHTEGNAADD
jgi:hypothetical protein